MTTPQVDETSVTVNKNSPIQDYVHPDDQTQPTFEMTPGFKPFTIIIIMMMMMIKVMVMMKKFLYRVFCRHQSKGDRCSSSWVDHKAITSVLLLVKIIT